MCSSFQVTLNKSQRKGEISLAEWALSSAVGGGIKREEAGQVN